MSRKQGVLRGFRSVNNSKLDQEKNALCLMPRKCWRSSGMRLQQNYMIRHAVMQGLQGVPHTGLPWNAAKEWRFIKKTIRLSSQWPNRYINACGKGERLAVASRPLREVARQLKRSMQLCWCLVQVILATSISAAPQEGNGIINIRCKIEIEILCPAIWWQS